MTAWSAAKFNKIKCLTDFWFTQRFALADGQSALETMSLEDFQKMFQDKKVVVFHKYSVSTSIIYVLGIYIIIFS